MRSYVVKRFSHFRHSRRRRIESASLLSRESTTLSFANPQKGHFMALAGLERVTENCNSSDGMGRSDSGVSAWFSLNPCFLLRHPGGARFYERAEGYPL